MLTVLTPLGSVSKVSSTGVTRVLRTRYYAHRAHASWQREQGEQYKDYSLTAYLLVPCNGNRNRTVARGELFEPRKVQRRKRVTVTKGQHKYPNAKPL